MSGGSVLNPFKESVLAVYPDAVVVGNKVLTLTPSQFLLANKLKYDILRNILLTSNDVNILNLGVFNEEFKLDSNREKNIKLLSFENDVLQISIQLRNDPDDRYFLRKRLSVIYYISHKMKEVNFPIYDFYSPAVYFDILVNNFRKDYQRLLEEYKNYNKDFLDSNYVSLLVEDNNNYNNIKNILKLMSNYSNSDHDNTDNIGTFIRILFIKMKLSLPNLDMGDIQLHDLYEGQPMNISNLNYNFIYNDPKICLDDDLVGISSSFFNNYYNRS